MPKFITPGSATFTGGFLELSAVQHRNPAPRVSDHFQARCERPTAKRHHRLGCTHHLCNEDMRQLELVGTP
jgi:hypothetical protein